MKPRYFLPVLIAFALTLVPQLAHAQEARPSAMKLYPYETVAFFRIAHGRELYERWRETSIGNMFKDPDIAPLVGGVWGVVGSAFNDNASQEAGFEWSDLSRIPQGEVAIGVIDRGETNVGILLLADYDGAQENVDFLLDLLETRWSERAMVVEEQEIAGHTVTIVRDGNNRSRSFGYLVKDSCLIASNDEVLLEHVIDRWEGRTPVAEPTEETELTEDGETTAPLPGERSFAENPKLQTILKECSTQLEEPPQILGYIDPVQLVRRVGRGNSGVSLALATFPALGLDGVMAAGGTISFATEKWDSVVHSHLLLDNPRAGVLTLLRFKEGDITPPNYVPDNVNNYGTTYLDIPGIYDRAINLYDHFRYEGAFADEVSSEFLEEFDLNIRDVFIDNAAGRISLVTSFDDPYRMQTEQHALCVQFEDPVIVQEAIAKIFEKQSDNWEQREFGGVTYYTMVFRWARDMPDGMRPTPPAIGVLDNTLILSMSESVLQQMIETSQGMRNPLADSIEYKVIQSRIERMTRGQNVVAMLYNNPAAIFRHWYEASQADQTRDGLARFAENSPFADNMLRVLEENELPSFDKLERYFAPTGGYLLDTNTGLHVMMFNLGREIPQEEMEGEGE